MPTVAVVDPEKVVPGEAVAGLDVDQRLVTPKPDAGPVRPRPGRPHQHGRDGNGSWEGDLNELAVSPTESLPPSLSHLEPNGEARGRSGSEPEGLHKLAQSRSARQFE